MPVSNKRYAGEKLPEGGTRRDQQSETRLGNKRDRTKAETGNRKTAKDETFSAARLEPETGNNLKTRSHCNILKMETGKPFRITKIGARIMSTITVSGHEGKKKSERTKRQNTDVHRC